MAFKFDDDYEEYKKRKKQEEKQEKIQQANQNIENYRSAKRDSMIKISNEIQERNKKIEEEKNKINQQVKKQIGPTVSQNYQEPNELPTINFKLANKEAEKDKLKELDSSALYRLSGGKIDNRTPGQKTMEDIGSVAGNVLMGAESVIPSSVEYLNKLNNYATKKQVEGLTNSLIGNNNTKVVGQVLGSIVGNKLYNQVMPTSSINNNLNNEGIKRWREEVIQNNINNTSNPIAKKLAEIAPSIGQNALPMVANISNPLLGTMLFITSAGGNYLNEAEKMGMSEGQALAYATAMAGVEGGSESLISADFVNKSIKKIGMKGLSNEILKNTGINIGENFLQEWATEYIDEYAKSLASIEGKEDIVKALKGQGKYANWDNIHTKALQSGIDGIISAVILDGASLGVASAVNVVQGKSNDIKQAFEDSKSVVNIDEIKDGVGKAVQNSLKTEIENTINNQPLPVDNEENTYANKVKESTIKEINNSNLSKEDKQQMISVINNLEKLTDNDISAIREILNNSSNNEKLDTKGNFKDNSERRKKYKQYQNDSTPYDSTIVQEVLESTPTNRNGRRTVKQWLEVAKEIGTRIADKSNSEIEEIAYKSWFEEQPSKSITQYDSKNKSNVAFQKFTSDEWINKINEGVNEARANNQVENNSIQEDVLPVVNEKYSVEDKIKTTRNTAEKYANYFKTQDDMNKIVSQLERISEIRNKYNKGTLNILFDDTINGNGIIEIDGDNRTIKLNPTTDRAVEFVLIHELSHDLKGTEGYNNLVNLVKEYNDGSTNYQDAFSNIKRMYEEYYKKNGLDLSKLDVNEEAVNDILGTALGTQEFVNRITQQDRNFAQKIYDWVKRQINIYKSENRELTKWLYKVQDNFERALKQQNKLKDGNKNSFSYVDDFNLREYNNINPVRIENKKTFASIADAIGRAVENEEIFPGINSIELYDYGDEKYHLYDIYYKDRDNWKIISDEIVNEEDNYGNERYSLSTYSGNEESGSENSNNKINNVKVKNERTMSANDGLFNQNEGYTNTSRQNNNESNTNKQIIENSNKSSFNLPKIKEGYTRLYRGINEEYNNNYDKSKLDNVNGYESWTDNYDLAKSYGDNVYYIDIPTSEIKNSIIDEDNNSETYGDRNLIYKNDKPVGINGKSGNEYMLYTEHDNHSNIQYNKIKNNSSVDNKGRKLTKEQQEYFKDSKARDENGNLLEVYHRN